MARVTDLDIGEGGLFARGLQDGASVRREGGVPGAYLRVGQDAYACGFRAGYYGRTAGHGARAGDVTPLRREAEAPGGGPGASGPRLAVATGAP